MTTFQPEMRFAIDWDGDFFQCLDAVPTDPLNIMHSGLSTDKHLVNLHWTVVNKSGINSATVSYSQVWTNYGIRQLNCVTGTNTTAGAYFGRTGSTNDFVVTNATTYTAVFWIKATVGSGTSFTISMENSTGSSTFTVGSDWKQITRTFTTTGTSTAFKIAKNTDATNVTFQVTGFMIVAGSRAPGGFNVGDASNLYDVLRAYDGKETVQSAQWVFGRHDWTGNLFDEGTLTLQLRNDDRIYMMENTNSPLYGKFVERLRVIVDTRQQGATTWTRLFTGWTDHYTPNFGKTEEQLTTTIDCLQGRFQLDRIQFNTLLSGTMTADEIISAVLLKGFTSAATPYQTILGHSQLGKCYLVNSDDIMDLDTGLSEIPVTGEDWGGDKDATRVLEDVMKVERGLPFIDRSGVVKFYNRTHYTDPATAPTATDINLDTDATSFHYAYGENHYNTVIVNYKPSDERTDIVWQTRENIRLTSRELAKEVKVKFEYEEGKKMTVTAVNSFTAASNPSTFTATAGGVSVASRVAVDFKFENGKGTLTLRNYTNQTVSFSVILRGSIKESHGGNSVEVSDDVRGGKITLSLQTKLITDEITATNLANHLLNIHNGAFGQFKSITIKNKNVTWYNRILNTGIGALVNVSETMSGHDQQYYIIGEDCTWTPGEGLNATFTLYPFFRFNQYWIVGTGVLGTSTPLGY